MSAASAARIATEVQEEATIAAKASEIRSIATELADMMNAIYEMTSTDNGLAGLAAIAKRVLITVETLAIEIENDVKRYEESKKAEVTSPKRTKPKAKRKAVKQ
jgi:hypothetical protein